MSTPENNAATPFPEAYVGVVLGSRQSRRPRRTMPSGRLVFEDAPLPLAGRDRVAWRVMSLLLCLAACRGGAASVEQLHVLSWAVRDDKNSQELLSAWNRGSGAPRLLRAWDPLLDDTLQLAHAAGLVDQRASGRQALSTQGAGVVDALKRDPESPMSHELQMLAALGKISESGMWERLGRRPPPDKAASRGSNS